ncbi:RNA transcription, translation and transport factor protein-like isoform X2 [Ostrea edulis]|uniref:RNA transcription, translation and transport factor protein-like isoform X2 n=1 Tax=Ostrea edulis TaxID=37623 RepID=UPI00209403C6|nr:RNA transcription, translation and transport factor protein-like isoform X2 [Ostrea edulis]
MFRRKLSALGYQQPSSFNAEDEKEFRNFIIWMEDQKIRHYKIEDRAALRNIKSSDWSKAHENYLKELNCPYQQSERSSVIEWLLGYAIRLEYGDHEEYKAADPSKVAMSQSDRVPSANPIDNLDFNDADFKAGITSLSMILQIPPHADHLEQLKAICMVVRDRLSQEALKKFSADSQGEQLPLDQTDLGFDTGDYIINEAAKILRLIHIKNLRDLQTRINAAIVGVQALIANPKTDSRLGKVGF